MAHPNTSVPVGSVLPYAGNADEGQLESMGWMICNGASLPLNVPDYRALFQAIGTLNGGDGVTHFNIPDFQGKFLRGLDTTAKIDFGAMNRVASPNGGVPGAYPGTYENASVACPGSSFAVTLNNLPGMSTSAGDTHWWLPDKTMLCNPVGSNFPFETGGDSETRPINASVNYIIKVLSKAKLPVGSIAPYAGASPHGEPVLGKYYAPCTGVIVAQASWSELFQAMGMAHGGQNPNFNLPDYRGYFLRGVDNKAGHDPDANTRSAMASGGNTGDAVGSVQGWATGRPANPFTVTISMGTGSVKTCNWIASLHCAYNDGSVDNIRLFGGDAETRPVNVGVDFYVLAKDVDTFPIGGIIAIPSDIPPSNSEWLPCDGTSIACQGQFAALYAAIGNSNGGDTTNFNLPDYRGQFLRGTDHGARRDPNVQSRNGLDAVGSTQGFATGSPSTPITGSIAHLPVDYSRNGSGPPNDACDWCGSNGTQTLPINGGDRETCPANVAVIFYIKWA